jgi:hypothetical protein
MSFAVQSSINSAIVSGQQGLKRASDGISQSAANLAALSSVKQTNSDPQSTLANAAFNQLGAIKQTLPPSAGGITNDLVSLSVNSINAQAAAKVVDTANDTIGTLLDILA